MSSHLRKWNPVYIVVTMFVCSWAAELWYEFRQAQEIASLAGIRVGDGAFRAIVMHAFVRDGMTDVVQLVAQACIVVAVLAIPLVVRRTCEEERKKQAKLRQHKRIAGI